MRIVVYNEKGKQLEKIENILIPKPTTYEGTLYVLYESMGFAVVTRIERVPGEKEREDVIAVKIGKNVYLYGELPESLAEKLGIEKEKIVARKVKV